MPEESDTVIEQDEVVDHIRRSGDVVHFMRHKYDAYVRCSEDAMGGYEVLHKHEWEDEWRKKTLGGTALKAELERLNWEIVTVSESPFESNYSDARCTCEDPDVSRTLAKGTPAEKQYCECGGYIP